ncbi:Gluconate 5-dehydrogenase protein [Marine Group I thaumarchaeote SCGC AAA799-P11]|uniref:Gluconate 5-dehydrogenase protein n=1 Tax=Marine Group I thaumarchaeote SCGC AAA799-P11 TaxID=1502295 RepID=A0A087S302_9ARCH|nr:Gluconate 5-dehydrogenase protein [Marine Group I thaumarchaeote SCGC AAA799-P11]
MRDIFSIKNKVIIVTGGGKGIGYDLAKNMAERNAYVYAIDIEFPNVIQNTNPFLFQEKCDITNYKKFEKVCDKIFKNYKKIDVLINCAGVSFSEQKQNTFYPIEKWISTINVNFTAAFNCSQTVIKHMIKNSTGSIINITSIVAEQGFPRNPAYNASKGGLKMLGKALAKDWGRLGIRVNNLGPGFIKTDITKGRYNNKKSKKIREERTLLGRWGKTDDLIGPCIFLASDASRYVTGQDLYVDGGWLTNSGIE